MSTLEIAEIRLVTQELASLGDCGVPRTKDPENIDTNQSVTLAKAGPGMLIRAWPPWIKMVLFAANYGAVSFKSR